MNLFGAFYGGSAHESDRQAHPTGVRLFFSVIKWHWSRLIKLNLLFLLTCVPIVTIPCAMTAMSKTMGLLLRRKICYPAHDFFKAFAAEWKRSSLVGLVLWGALLLAGFGVWAYSRMEMSMGLAFAAVCALIAVVAMSAMIYAFPMVAFTELRVRDVLKNAVLLAQMRFPQTLLVLVEVFALIALTYFGGVWTVWILPLIGFSLIALTGTYVAWGAMSQYVIRDDQSTADDAVDETTSQSNPPLEDATSSRAN